MTGIQAPGGADGLRWGGNGASKTAKILPVALWIAQLLLAAVLIMSGGFKLTVAYPDLVKMATEGGGLVPPEPLLRFIGGSELAGGLGMILPAATRIMPVLTAWAAVGLGTIMVLATALHLSRSEWPMALMTAVLLGLSAFVA